MRFLLDHPVVTVLAVHATIVGGLAIANPEVAGLFWLCVADAFTALFLMLAAMRSEFLQSIPR